MRPVVTQRRQEGAAVVAHRTAQVDGLSVFYREAGDPASPNLLLLGGFPASSHQFRNLIPALADRFHVLSPRLSGLRQHRHARPGDVRLHVRPPLGDRRGRCSSTIGLHGSLGPLHAGLRRPDRQSHHRPPSGLARVAGDPELQRLRGGLHRGVGRHPPRALARPNARRPRRRSMPFLEPDGVKLLYLHGPPRPRPDQPRQLEHGPPLPRAPRRAPGPARPALRLPHQRRAVPGLAGLPPRARSRRR